MRKLTGILALAMMAVLPSATLAAGHPEVDAWKEMCLATRGDLTAALRKAETAGWTALPADEAVAPPQFEYSDARRSSAAADRQTLMVARHRDSAPEDNGWKTNQCMTSQRGATDSPVPAMVAALGYLPNVQSFGADAEAEWLLEERDGRLQQIASDDEAGAEKAFKEHRAVMVHATLTQGISVISYETARERR